MNTILILTVVEGIFRRPLTRLIQKLGKGRGTGSGSLTWQAERRIPSAVFRFRDLPSPPSGWLSVRSVFSFSLPLPFPLSNADKPPFFLPKVPVR